MQSLNKMPFTQKIQKNVSKNTLAYLCALTLLFSYAEMILPRFVPFFRLGLANTVILLALDINFISFIILSVLKATAACVMGGTLFSPFFVISLLQSILSALVMRFLYKIVSKKAISMYGISVAGSAVSAAVQIVLAALYLGKGTYALLGPMMIFNTISGIITAFFAEKTGIKQTVCNLEENSEISESKQSYKSSEAQKTRQSTGKTTGQKTGQIILALILIAACVSVFFIKNLIALGIALIISLTAQKLSKRKIYILPHLSLWLFIFISALFVPNGKVLFKIWNISITRGALLLAAQKALTLSTVSALSQCAVCLKPDKNSLIGQSLEYYRLMNERFLQCKGSIIKRITFALNLFANDVFANDEQVQLIQTRKPVQ